VASLCCTAPRQPFLRCGPTIRRLTRSFPGSRCVFASWFLFLRFAPRYLGRQLDSRRHSSHRESRYCRFVFTLLDTRAHACSTRHVHARTKRATRALTLRNSETAVVALPNVHWTDGWFLDLELIAESCRRAGAMLCLDLTQSLGVLPFEGSKVRPGAVPALRIGWSVGFLTVH
jgi:hypothetical protein